jgi:hypothetical protein
MRKYLLLLVVGASACASRAAHPTFAAHPTYTCGDGALALNGTRVGWHDEAGDHFVAWPVSPTDVEAVEVVVPGDPREDAVRMVYDTSKGSSRADWKLLKREMCTVKGGYSDVLARYLRGESLDQLSADLALGNRDDAKAAVHTAMLQLQRRYYTDH